MPIQPVNVGQAADDGTGDPYRTAMQKINANIDLLDSDKASATDVGTALDLKVDKVAGMGLSSNDFTDGEQEKLAALESSHFKGLFDSLAALQAAHPTAIAGDYANVDPGAGSQLQRYLWDSSDNEWTNPGGAAPELTPAQVLELYESNPNRKPFTDAKDTKLEGIAEGATNAGAYGLGRTIGLLVTDFNSLSATGFYLGNPATSAASGLPVVTSGHHVMHFQGNPNTNAHQIAQPASSNAATGARVFVRQKFSGTWQGWVEITALPPLATTTTAGLMSAADKLRLETSVVSVAGASRNVLPADDKQYLRFTSEGVKEAVFNSNAGFVAGQSFEVANRSVQGRLSLTGVGVGINPFKGGSLSLLPGDAVKLFAVSSTVIDVLYGSTAPAQTRWPLPAITDENSTFNDEGTSTAGWAATGGTMSVADSWLRLTKTGSVGAACSVVKNWTFTPANRDYILYGKVRASAISQMDATLLAIYNGTKECSIWLGSSGGAAGGGTGYATGSASITGYAGATLKTDVIAASGGMDYTTTAFEFALQYDTKFAQLNCWIRETDGRWKLKARLKCDYVSHTSISIAKHSQAPTGGWFEFDYLTLCQPNIVAIGDSHCAGSTLFNADSALGLNNDNSSWMRHSKIYPELRNNLVVNKGVGGQSSAQILARISDVTQENPRVVFLHASSNDAGTIALAARTTNVQSAVNAVNTAGAGCVLLNGLYATSAYTGSPGNPAYRDYMLSWWNTEKPKLTGLAGYIDIMAPVTSGGFLSPVYAQADNVHLNIAGYTLVGEHIASGTDM